MDRFNFTGNMDLSVMEEQYRLYLQDPSQLDEQWRLFFEGFDFAQKYYPVKKQEMGVSDELKVLNLINGYRQRGHYFTKTNPVRVRRKYEPTLDIGNFGLEEQDLERRFHAGHEIGLGEASLKDILVFLNETYCHSVGVEFMYIRNVNIVQWIKEHLEVNHNRTIFSKAGKKRLLESLTRAVGFEKFLHRKFPGYKTFSLEGGEALIPAMEAIVERAAALDYENFVIGMPHRGRLNVLANILHKPLDVIFREFDGGSFEEAHLLGDVKYHLGYSSTTVTSSGRPIHLTLSPNPSHLEAVGPVVSGITRSLADRKFGGNLKKTLPFIIHGDAAISGQGVVYELLQMSELPAYRNGGSIHFVVNNQLGFTTNYLDGRSSIYCTDIAKVIQSPIFHVNGDDLEAVVHVSLLAIEYLHTFGKDVFIDLLCYRKYGHNESDEPRFTQPLLYKIIEKHPNPLEIYREQLLNEASISQEAYTQLQEDFAQNMEQGLFASKRSQTSSIRNFLENTWSHLSTVNGDDFPASPATGIEEKELLFIGEALTRLPESKPFFGKIRQLQQARADMIKENRIDWATAELLAFGSLLKEGYPIRMSGQDVERGTFSQRHAVLMIEDSEEEYIPLNAIANEQTPFEIYNSLLSEYAVLGFEYGYALANPNGMTIWEAQFGDFINGAQIIIDQFLSSAEAKWNVSNGLVVLLPHGYEGQGPEHSNGRMERFLTACASNNIQVANCSTPANYFHLLRRQMHRNFRKPLVVFTPKSLLRHSECVSSVEAFTRDGFREVMPDIEANPDLVKRLIFCTGKVYYDLWEARQQRNRFDTAIIRIEQLYPFPEKQIKEEVQKYPQAEDWLWVQEEPANMGAWSFLLRHFTIHSLLLVARPESGSTAGGSAKTHKIRQQKIIDKAFGDNCCEKKDKECRMICARDEELIRRNKE